MGRFFKSLATQVCVSLTVHMDSSYYLNDWSPHLTVLTSNIDLIVHSIFSRAHRKEIVQIFHEFKVYYIVLIKMK